MRTLTTLLVAGACCAVASCHSNTSSTPPTGLGQPAPPLQGIWQLDYYPDSLLLRKDIYAYSNWSSPYAATIRFAGDSCELSGWHESWWVKPRLVDQDRYRLGDPGDGQYFELEMVAGCLLFREVHVDESGKPDSAAWYPYHRVATALTQPALAQRVAREIFAGRYRVLQSDLKADSIVTLGGDFSVQGLRGVARYDVVTAMDWDFLLPNAFSWQDPQGKEVSRYSFAYSGDTLLLNGFEMRPEDDSVPSGVEVTAPEARFLKLPPHSAPAVAGRQRPAALFPPHKQ